MSNKRLWPWFLTIIILIVVDWASKVWVLGHVTLWKGIQVASFFDLRLAFNRGMAFGFLRDHSGWQVAVLTLLALIVSGILCGWLCRARAGSCYLKFGLSCIVGGALGNALDRVLHGYVIDFLDFHAFGWHFWTFNLADLFITVGVVGLLLDWIIVSPENNSRDR